MCASSHAKQAAALDRKFRALKPFDKHCTLSIEGGINRMPMERTAGVAALYQKAQAIAKQIDWKLEEAAVGGGSDGNFTAGMGIPTLDGMGGRRPGRTRGPRTHRNLRTPAPRPASRRNDRKRLKHLDPCVSSVSSVVNGFAALKETEQSPRPEVMVLP